MADLFNENNVTNVQEERTNPLLKKFEGTINTVKERQENRERYQVDLPDNVYAELNKVIAQSDNPEEEAYKWGTAYKYAQTYGVSLEDAITNVDNYNKALWPDRNETSYKGWFEAVCDAGVLGNNSWKMGNIGNQIMNAERDGDEEKLAILMEEYNAVQADSETRYDNVPRPWIVNALKTGAESAPFTFYTGMTALFGNMIQPGLGTAASFAESSYITTGQEYMSLREKGVSPEVAYKVAMTSGAIQGAIETALGSVGELAAAGKAAKAAKAGTLSKDIVGKITDRVAKTFHFGPAGKLTTDFVMRYAKDVAGEGFEEGLQEITSIIATEVAASMDDIGISAEERYEYLDRVVESVKGGIIGAVVLGLPVSSVRTGVDIYAYKQIQEAAQTINSKKMFEEAVSDSPLFEEMDEQTKKETIDQIYNNFQKERDEVWTKPAAEMTEVNKANEGYEEVVIDEETGEEIVSDVYREDNGRLYVNNVIKEDGKSGSYRFGDPSKKNNNLYGNIEYNIDENTNTVTINEFSLNDTRESLRAEVFDNFAQEFAGHKIIWETKGNLATRIKEDLIAANPRGKKNGLNYYLDKNDSDIDTRRSIISQTLKVAPQIRRQDAAGLALYMESIARHNGKTLSEFYKETFGTDVNGNLNQMYGSAAEGELVANENGYTFDINNTDYKLAGGITRKRFNAKDLMNEYHSIIYVGENGDFSTLVHEVTHAARHHLSPEILAQAEELVGVVDHNWTEQNDEDLADLVEDYFMNETPNLEDKKRTVLEKIGDFFKNILNALKDTGVIKDNDKLTEELTQDEKIKNFFDNLTGFTQDQFRSTVESMNKVSEAQQTAQKTQVMETVQKNQQEQVETELDQNDPYVQQLNEILDRAYIPQEAMDEVKNILADPASTVEDKTKAIEYAKSVEKELKNVLFQVYNENITKIFAKNVVKNEVLKSFEKANEIYDREKRLQINFNEKDTLKRVKLVTGWDKLDGKWVYQTNDYTERDWTRNSTNKNKKFSDFADFAMYVKNSPATLVNMSKDTVNPIRLKDLFIDKTINKYYPQVENTIIKFVDNESKKGLFSVSDQNELQINLDYLTLFDKSDEGIQAMMSEATQYIIASVEGQNAIYALNASSNLDTLSKAITNEVSTTYSDEQLLNTLKNEAYKFDNKVSRAARLAAMFALNKIDPKSMLLEDVAVLPRINTIENVKKAVNILNDRMNDTLFQELTRDEIDDVREKYKGSDMWLKAPNGNPTNLNERQWLQVRTPKFKAWFGDWENDPANASKIVDENGEPKVVYHDTNATEYINQETGQNWDDLDFLEKDQWNERNDWENFWKEQDFYVFSNKKARYSCEMPAYFFAPEMDEYHEYGKRTIQTFLNIRNPAINPKIENVGVTDWAGLEAMDKLIEAGYDGFIRMEDGKIYETNSFYPTQIKSATENNGDYDSLNPDIRFQEVTPEMRDRAYKYLSTFEDTKEMERILANLNNKEISDTQWGNLVINCLNVREDLQKLLKGEDIPEDSLFNKSKTYKKFVSGGVDNIYRYFDSKSSLIGGDGDTKALYSVAGSFVNCNPSPACAKYCYAAKGRSGMATMILNRELINWCIENDPVRAAEIVERQYHRTGTIFENKLALRLLDTGDLSQQWVTFVKELNDKGISCSIFSKRPEILEQIDQKKNVIQLSLDKTNAEIGKKYPNLPKAWVLGEAVLDDNNEVVSVDITEKDRQFLDENMQTYLDRGGVILPLVVRKGTKVYKATRENLLTLPKWTRNYTCPLDAGWKAIGNESERETNTDTWNCSVCDKNGQGCSFIRAAKDRMKQFALLKDIPQGVINDIYKQQIETLEEQLRKLGRPESEIRSIIDPMVAEWTQKLDAYVTGAEGAVSSRNSTGTSGQKGEIKGTDVLAQELDREYLEAVKNGDLTKAKAMVDAKIAEQVEIFSLLQDDQNEEGFKLYRGKAPSKIVKMYAVFNVSQDGFRAAYAGNKNPTPVGVWLSAQSLKSYVSDLLSFDDGTAKSYIVGDTGSPAGNYFSEAKLKEYGLSKSTKMLLKRAGKHGVMDVPNFSQMNLGVDENGQPVKNKKADGALPHNKLVFEIECGIDEDGDLTEYVKTNGRMEGSKNEGLEELEPNRFYQYKTNPNASGQWGLASTYRILRLVPYEEVVAKTQEANEKIKAENEAITKRNEGKAKKDQEKLIKEIPLQKWVNGYKPEDSNLTVESVDQMYKDGKSKKLQDPVTYDDYGNVIPLSERFNMKIEDARFQTAYHGSGANFDKFDTENYGLSGEGSMSFGYGAYVSGSEEIAIDYATRQDPAKEAREQFKALVQNVLSPINEGESTETVLNKGYDWANKVINDNNGFYTKDTKLAAQLFKSLLDKIDNGTNDYNYILELADKTLDDYKTKNLYFVDIPDNGFIKWDEKVTKEDLNNIAPYYVELMENEMATGDFAAEWPGYTEDQKNTFRDNWRKEIVDNTDRLGGELYYHLYHSMPRSKYPNVNEAKKAASKLLAKAGYKGIDYPAGTIHGTDKTNARNYVVFNDEDAQIVDHILFQTLEELNNDAAGYDTWEAFMEAYTSDMSPEAKSDPFYHNQVPYNADAQWYQTTWEKAKGLVPEESLNQQEINEKLQREGQEAGAMDVMFIMDLQKNPLLLDDFLIRIAEIDEVDLNDWQDVEDEKEAAVRDRYSLLQDFIATQLTHGNWIYNAQRVRNGKELTQGARNRILGLIRANPRQYRAIYSEIMETDTYAVPEEDTMQNQLAGKLKRYKLVAPNEDIETINPERMKKLADEISNIEVASKIKNGTIKNGSELDNYLKALNKQIREQEREFNELEKETQADYQRIADAEKRDLLRLHEKLLHAKSKLNTNNKEVERLLSKGLKISDKYRRNAQNLRADYNEIFRKFKDLESVIRIDSQIEEALKRQEQVVQIREDLNKKKNEKNAVAEIKRLRIQLVKRVMRRVPFERIDYDNAKKLIAIQRVLEPNLLGGVNRWIGTESPVLREVISGLITDVDYREEIIKYLNKGRVTQGRLDFIKLLNETQSIEQFNQWTKKQRAAAIRYLPKEDWVRDLNLLQLAKEREESIDLEIDMTEVEQPMVDENGNQIINKATGEPYIQITWQLNVDPEVAAMVQDVVGTDMYNNMINRPFADWTTEELENLAVMVNTLYKEGRDLLKAKREEQKQQAAEIRNRIEKTIKNTGIIINDDDDDETKARKVEKINKILGLQGSGLKGTEAGKDKGFMARANRLLHSYNDANIRRVARILDNTGEGINTNELYWKENAAYNAKEKSIKGRAELIQQVMKDNKITVEDLASIVTVEGRDYTVDELLYFLAASYDVAFDDNGKEDYYAATSKNAVMFGNMFSAKEDLEQKATWIELNDLMYNRIQTGQLTQEEKELQVQGLLDTQPGTTAYKNECIRRFEMVIAAARNLDDKYQALLKVIQDDYAAQYERMNKVSIDEFNAPVHRVKSYVPLVRLESNGDTNENQVKEDLLATMGSQTRQYVNKGMTQRRTNQGPLHQKPVQTGLYKTWSNSVERTEHFIAYAPYVRELNRVYKSRDAEYTRRYIESRYGKGMIKYIDDYINEVANPNANKVRNAGDELLRTLRGKTAPAYLAWKASAIIKQGATSPWPYMQFVNPAEYLAASWKCIASRGKMYDLIRNKSVFMAKRVMDPMNDLIDEMADQAKNKFDRKLANFNKKGMAGLEWIDWICVAPGWLACYEKQYAALNKQNEEVYQTTKARLQAENDMIDFNSPDYMSEDQIESKAREAMIQDVEQAAVDYADDCTRLCQPSNRSVDIAPLFKNSSEAMKAYLQFQTSLNVIWQNLRYDLPYNVKNNMGFRIAGTIVGYALAGIFMNSIMNGYSDDGDDEDKKALREFIYYATTQFTDAVPMIGSELTNTMDKVITGKKQFMNSGTDMTPTASKFFSIVTNATKGDWIKAAEMTAEGFAMSLGLPVSGAKEIKKLFNIGNKKEDPGLDLGNVYGIVDNVIDKEE